MYRKTTWEPALARLINGNRRFQSGLRSVEALMASTKIKELATQGQKPFAIVVACSDSRVPAEIVFDCGLGELFVIRMAGNIVTEEVIASIEFAATSFGSPLCIVLGHSSCGAIHAAIDVHTNKCIPASAHIRQLLSHIETPLCECKQTHDLNHPEFESLVTEKNVEHSSKQISEHSSIIRNLVSEGRFKIIGSVYDVQNGEVRFHEEAARMIPTLNTELRHVVQNQN